MIGSGTTPSLCFFVGPPGVGAGASVAPLLLVMNVVVRGVRLGLIGFASIVVIAHDLHVGLTVAACH
eukprot:scaffold322792_cov83-Cyclotella_meneghiniana.AAC.3